MREAAPDVPRGCQDYWRGSVKQKQVEKKRAVEEKRKGKLFMLGKRETFLILLFLPLTMNGSRITFFFFFVAK